jgi:hypothetical protein
MLSSLPSEITQLTKLNEVYFDCNALEITDTEIIQFLNAKQSNWRQTQTISPKQLTITTITGNAISLTWSPIAYTSHQGGYEIYYSPSDNDSYTIYDITKDKTIEQMTISGLHPDTIYYFKIRSVTAPHTSGNFVERNFNTVYSKFTPDISARTLPLIAMAKQSLSGVMNDSNISIDITGSYAYFYIYKLNQNEWSEEFSINLPITLYSLEDASYTLLIKEKIAESWQYTLSVYTWRIDTKVEPPDLNLPSNWDTGTLNNDHITNATQLTLTGTCEKDATIEFYDNLQPINYQNITFNNNTFTATFTLTKGTHTITAIQTDLAENKSQTSTALQIRIDTQIDNFSIDESIIDSPCLWVLTPQNITLTGTLESQSTISINTIFTNSINISYPDDHTWSAQLINMPIGNDTILIQATDLAGNKDSIEKSIHLIAPETVSIDTQTDTIFADHPLSMTLTFYTTDNQPICVASDIDIVSSMGQILDETKGIANNQLFCQFKGTQTGTARITAFFQDKALGSKDIDILPGPFEKLGFNCTTPIIETGMATGFITLQLMDAFQNPTFVPNLLNIKLDSTASTLASFGIQKGDAWEWQPAQVFIVVKPEINTFQFTYQSSEPGNFFIQAITDQPSISQSLPITVVNPPLALIPDAPSGPINYTTVRLQVQGDITAYQYQHNDRLWQAETSIDTPIILTHLTDGVHTIGVIGKNILNKWQNQAKPTIAQWIVDTHVLPPAHLFLPQLFDTGSLNNDLLTRLTRLEIRGECESNAAIEIYCNDLLWKAENIVVDQHAFVATLVLSEGKHQISAIQIDAAANRSEPSEPLLITVDQTAPEITILSQSNTGEITQFSTTSTWQWTASEPNCTFRFDINQNADWTATGDFTSVTSGTLSTYDGHWYLHVQAKDPAGNVSAVLSVPIAIVDSHVSPPELSLPSQWDTGRLTNDHITHMTPITITGMCENGASIQFFDHLNPIHYESIAFDHHTFSASIVLPEGNHQLTAIQTDSAGNVSNASTPLLLTIDTHVDNFSLNAIKDETQCVWAFEPETLTLSGNREKDSIIHATVNTTPIPIVYPDAVTWQSDSGGDGVWYIHVQARDLAGNVSEKVTVPALLDNTPPVVAGLSDTSTEISDCKEWFWYANETNCSFRYAIDQNEQWEGFGVFSQITQFEKCNTFDRWYLHVQAKDAAGNYSVIKTVLANFEKPYVEFSKFSSMGKESETSVQIELSLSHPVDQDVWVTYQSIRGETYKAIEDLDYALPKAHKATIIKGNQNGVIQLTIMDDHQTELEEQLGIQLLDSNVTIQNNSIYVFLIQDNDDPGLAIAPSNAISLTEGGYPESLTIVLKSKPRYSVSIDIQDDSQRLQITPKFLTFESEQWNTLQQITIETKDDRVYNGTITIDIVFNLSSRDDDYKTISQTVSLDLHDNETPPTPPILSCPKYKSKNAFPEFTWDSGGGSNRFLYQLDNNAWSETTSNSYKSQALSEGPHVFSIKEYNEFTSNWSNIATCPMIIDTGKPCSKPVAVLNLNAESMSVDITYTHADTYSGETCENSLSSGSGVQKVALWVAEPSVSGNLAYSLYQTDEGELIDGYFEYPPGIEGRYRFITSAMDSAGNDEWNQLPDPYETYDAEIVFAENFSGYAILAVGTVGGEGLNDHTLSADNIYKHLIDRHFGIMHDPLDPLDHIKYLNMSESTGVDEVQTATSYWTSLKNGITQWAVQKMKMLRGPLYIILIDHGAPDLFYLGNLSETFTSTELNEWICSLESSLKQNNIQPHEIVIVIDTCYSGSFMDELSSSGRIIITSTAENEVSFRGPKTPSNGYVRDGAFFASNLFNEFRKGLSLSESFVNATYLTEMLTSSSTIRPCFPFYDQAAQHPLINDNNDNKGHNSIYGFGDGLTSDHITLGFAKTSTHPVEINDVIILPNNILEHNEQILNFKVFVSNQINPDQHQIPELCVEIRQPDTQMQTYTDDYMQKILDLQQTCLTYNNSDKAYLGSYNELIDPGKYSFYFYVEDTDQIITYFDEISVYKKQKGNHPPAAFQLIRPVDLNDPKNSGSEVRELQQVILEWENTHDPENNAFTYTLFLSKSNHFEPDPKQTIIKKNIIHEQMMINLPGNSDWTWDDSKIYWKVRAMDEFGEYRDTKTFMFKTDYNNSGTFSNKSPIMFVHVFDVITKLPVPFARLKFDSDNTTVNLTMRQSGRYIGRFNQKPNRALSGNDRGRWL